jgi:hypothetical protein
MAKTYSHDYLDLYIADAHGDECASEFYTEMFEREAREHLRKLRAKDVGAVILYMDTEGREAAYFDYENMRGSVYTITGRRSDEI